MNTDRLQIIILWAARISAGIILAFTIFMVGAHIINPEEADQGLSFKDGLSFFFFPVCMMIGLALAFKKEGLGGLVSTIGFVGLYIVRPDLLLSFITVLAIPGLLFLLFWYLDTKAES